MTSFKPLKDKMDDLEKSNSKEEVDKLKDELSPEEFEKLNEKHFGTQARIGRLEHDILLVKRKIKDMEGK